MKVLATGDHRKISLSSPSLGVFPNRWLDGKEIIEVCDNRRLPSCDMRIMRKLCGCRRVVRTDVTRRGCGNPHWGTNIKPEAGKCFQ